MQAERRLERRSATRLWLAAVAIAGASACASAERPMLRMADGGARAACRQPAAAALGPAVAPRIAWTAPVHPPDRQRLDAWCAATAAPVILQAATRATAPTAMDDLAIVSWNVHGDAGDIAALIERLQSGALTGGRPARRFVLLLQEVRRRVGPAPRRGPDDVVAIARARGLSLYYVPSQLMHGRGPDDRGNAILSTEPLSGYHAIELPFERQRRMAIEASVAVAAADGTSQTVRLANVHLESTASARRLRLLASGPRQRQARALLEALGGTDDVILAGDFNTWFGFSDATYRTVAAALPDASARDRRRTFAGLFRLDHVFARPPAGWTVQAARLDDRHGSDHYPLLAWLAPSPRAHSL
jgi:endonuclease/exonuclease/phosphatase family metal-dependent hydrolase